jgi:hypothetical protein
MLSDVEKWKNMHSYPHCYAVIHSNSRGVFSKNAVF